MGVNKREQGGGCGVRGGGAEMNWGYGMDG